MSNETDGDESTFADFKCPLCQLLMTPPGRKPLVMRCGHTICEDCLPRLPREKCPICKSPTGRVVHCFLLSEIIENFLATHKVPIEANPPSIATPMPSYRGICSYAEYGRTHICQRWYHCKTCQLVESMGCCQVCAENCHRGHDVVYYNEIEGFCDCGAGEAAPCQCLRPSSDLRTKCSLIRTGLTYVSQPWFHCLTCKLIGNEGCCQACAMTCHAGHEITGGQYEAVYCHCGMSGAPLCKCMTEKMKPHCTFFETRKTKTLQELYFCRTCGVVNDKYICKHCAGTCHAGHIIEKVGNIVGYCQCGLKCTIKQATPPNVHVAVELDVQEVPARRRLRGGLLRRDRDDWRAHLPIGMV